MGALRSYTGPLWHCSGGICTPDGAGGEQHWQIGLWLALAVNGSDLTTPRTANNERAFAIRNYGHGRKAKTRKKWKNKKRRSKKISEPVKPQIWLTLIWHMGLKLPWSWRTGPSTASERGHLLEMIETAQSRTSRPARCRRRRSSRREWRLSSGPGRDDFGRRTPARPARPPFPTRSLRSILGSFRPGHSPPGQDACGPRRYPARRSVATADVFSCRSARRKSGRRFPETTTKLS